jgi:hypothetical protein
LAKQVAGQIRGGVAAAGFAEAKGDSGHPQREVGGYPFSDMSERLQNAGAVPEGADVRPTGSIGEKGLE